MARPVKMKIGERFTMLTVIERVGSAVAGQTRWLCLCDCGQKKTVYSSSLRRGHTKSCGCSTRILNSISHRKSDSVPAGPTRNTWASMNSRCYNRKSPDYAYYGGRGISVCERWQRPDGYWNFVSDMGQRPEGMTLDREDIDGDYCPENCRWVTRQHQQNNRRTTRFLSHGERTMALGEWAMETGISVKTLWSRLNLYNWPVAQALGFEPRN